MSVCTCTAKIRLRSYNINKKYKLKAYLIKHYIMKFSFSLVQSLSRAQLFVTPRTAPCQAPLSITNSWNLLKLVFIESVMPSTISSSVVRFSSCPQSFPASGCFPVSQFFASGGQSIEVSSSASVLPMNT